MIVVSSALFLLGAYLSLRAIAALYAIIDLWYAIRSAYPRVIGGILIWLGAIAVIVMVLGARHRAAFVYGIVAFVVFYLSLYLARNLVFGVLSVKAAPERPRLPP